MSTLSLPLKSSEFNTISSAQSSFKTAPPLSCTHLRSFSRRHVRSSPVLAQTTSPSRVTSSSCCGYLGTQLLLNHKSQMPLERRANVARSSLPFEGQRSKSNEGQKLTTRIAWKGGFLQDSRLEYVYWTWSYQSLKVPRMGKEFRAARAGIDAGYEFEDAFGSLTLPLAPEPVLFPRKMLNLKFAVLLMRSAYEAVDALDFIPMDKFQIKFWKLRQSEVEPYTLQCRPLRVKYGDLTDPDDVVFQARKRYILKADNVYSFKVHSFSQFATISNEIRTGEVVFQEKMGSDGELRTVRRDERLKDNAMLPAAFKERAGKLLYEKLLEGFEGEVFNVPPPCDSPWNFSSVTKGVKELLQVFVDKGYALKASVEPVQYAADKPGGKLRVKLEGSATQWGVRALASRRSLLLNDFAALAVSAYLQASGCTATQKVRYSDTFTEQLWTIV